MDASVYVDNAYDAFTACTVPSAANTVYNASVGSQLRLVFTVTVPTAEWEAKRAAEPAGVPVHEVRAWMDWRDQRDAHEGGRERER